MKKAKKKLKTVYLSADRGIPVLGNKGASVHIRSLVGALQLCGCQAVVVTANLGKESGLKASFPAVEVRADNNTKDILCGWRELETNQNLLREIECLYLNSALERELLNLYSQVKYDFIYERYSLWSIAGATVARKLRLPFILEVNSPLVEEQRQYRNLELEPLALAVAQLNFHLADKIIAVSKDVQEYLVRSDIHKSKVVVMPNGVDPERFKPRKKVTKSKFFDQSAEKNKFVIGFVGSLKPWHGVRFLAQAFRKLHSKDKSYHLLIVGDGPERAYLEQLARKETLNGSMTLVGAVKHDQIPDLIQAMDVTVAPYPNLEDFYFSPLKLFEYMASGKPVIASACGQIESLIQHKREGYLVSPGDQVGLAEAIETVRNNPGLAYSMGKKAAEKVRRNYTWENNASKVISIVEELKRKK